MIIERRLREVFEIDPAGLAMETDGQWSTWGEMAALVARIRERLDEAEASTGARVGILMRNRTSVMCAIIAVIVSDRCTVSFNPMIPPERLAADLESQGPAVLIGPQGDLETPEVLAAGRKLGIPFLRLPENLGDPVVWAGEAQRTRSGAGQRLAPDVLVEMLTSGTTGPPKRIPLLKRVMDESFTAALEYESAKSTPWPALKTGVRIIASPLTHIGGIYNAIITLADGRGIALMGKFSVEGWVSAVERHGVKVSSLPPAALRMILDAGVPKARLASLIAVRSGTAPLAPEIIDEFQERYGLPVMGQYGATEFAGTVAGWTIKDFRNFYPAKRGSVGRMQANVQGRVVDPETGREVEPGKPGVLEVRGSQLGDGSVWVRTTDEAAIDADGFLFILGRTDNAINRGGFKVQPDEVARAIARHPGVKEAVVVGIADPRLGEVPVAVVTPKQPGHKLEPEDLREFAAGELAPYQIPAAFKVLEAIPLTPNLKPSTPDIRKLFEGERA